MQVKKVRYMKQLHLLFSLSLIVYYSLFSVSSHGGTVMKKKEIKPLNVTSSAFKHNEMIPAKYTCDGENVSPPIAWEGVPEGTESLVLIADDPDAPMGIWVHWVVFNIPETETGLAENVPARISLDNGANQGMSSFKQTGYGGPCPPSGTHRYFFKVSAVDTRIDMLEPRYATKEKVLDALDGHVLAYGELIGTYKRQK